MKIVLVHPPHVFRSNADGTVKIRTPSWFPLNLGYIAKVLLKAGHNVEILEIHAHQYTKEEVIEKIKTLEYDVIGISALSTQYAYVKWLAARLKEHSRKPVILGGALSTLSWNVVLKHSLIDICVLGEGEQTAVDLLDHLDNLESVKGIAFREGLREDGEIIRTPPREYIKDLDSIDFPAWDIFPMDIYFQYSKVGHIYNIKSLNVVTSRGCPYNCHFCSKVFSRVRMRSVDNILSEIKELKQRYNIEGVTFGDELLLATKSRSLEICEKIKPLKLKWDCTGRANQVHDEVLRAAKEAGCVGIAYGIESGSQKILNNMNKATTVEQNKRAIIATKKAGIKPEILFMYGYPGESKETIQENIEFVKEVKHFVKGASVTTALPGTKLYADALSKGLITDEDKYLELLDRGYASGERFLINFTDFTEEEFYRYKEEMEKTFHLIALGKDPRTFFRYVNYLFKLQVKKYGLKRAMGRFYREGVKYAGFCFKKYARNS